MINKLIIRNFKSLSDFETSCSSLNLFTGTNGVGKSTVLQSLLLLRQSYKGGFFFMSGSPLFLGNIDSLVNLGTFKDVLSSSAPKYKEHLYFQIISHVSDISFITKNYNSDIKDYNFINGSLNQHFSELEKDSLFNNNFQYLSAERISPKEDYPRFSSNDSSLGKDGSYTAHFIQKFANRDILIPQLKINENIKSLTLIDNVNYWMGLISNNIEVLTKENLGTNRVELSFRYHQSNGVPTQDFKPSNVGFGITHTLPIVVAILASKPGDLILIENPETHLHPAGQSSLAKLIALASANGVQFFIETHSDHIINGIRVAIKHNLIDNSKVKINYFSKNEVDELQLDNISIDEDGGLSEWPEGFFDEWENSLNDLL